jgi:two-component system chemotaxis response regulator CheB
MGLKSVKDNGGLTIVQDPNECQVPTMTLASMNATNVDHVFSTNRIVDFLLSLR